MVDKDLVIAVGGDGTILNTASFMDDTIPVLGVNSDPTRLEEKGVTNLKDERRSRGALCGTTANTGIFYCKNNLVKLRLWRILFA